MSLAVIIVDALGTRTLAEQDLPLSIGTAADSVIRVPGPVVRHHSAQIGVLDGRVFVTVTSKGSDVSVNESAISGTRWLDPADTLRVAGAGIHCDLSADALTVRVDYRGVDYATAPPLPDDPAAAPARVIPPLRSRAIGAEASTAAGGRYRNRIFAGLGLLLLAALYMFTAVTVVIKAEPPDAAISMPGSWLTPGGGGRYLLWPGNYALLIEAPGFAPYTGAVDVRAGERAEFSFSLQELPGRVQLRTVPETAGEIRIDGQPAGSLPASDLPVARGKHELRITAPRFLEYVTTIEVAGRDQSQVVEATLAPAWADVSIATDPPGAEIRVGDDVLGITPATVELLSGTQQVELHKSGYRTLRHALNIVPGQAQELPVFRLEEAGGLLRITSTPAGAAVTVQGQFAGNTPLEYEVAKGRNYTVTVSKAGYATASRSVAVADEPADVALTLAAKTGRLTIVAEPADAQLYVDNQLVGEASRDIDLLAVPHQLEVRKAGYDSWFAKVTPKPGLPQRLDVRLRTPEQAALDKIPATITTSQGQRLKLIRTGKFVMGAPRREQGRRPNEIQRSVELKRRFYFAEREVTNREFRAFRPQHTSGAEKYRELAGDNQPAVMLSWEDAAAYCNWLSDQEGLPRAYKQTAGGLMLATPRNEGYRLPTEAEWEWVARFGAGQGERRYPWGDAMPPPANSGNYADTAAAAVASNTIGNYTDGYPVTAPVGSFPADRAGIYDLGGNAAEWVNDRYSVAAGTDAVLIDPAGPAEGQYHVIRGSGWRHASISELRMAYRDFGDRGRLDVGFRIARDLPGQD